MKIAILGCIFCHYLSNSLGIYILSSSVVDNYAIEWSDTAETILFSNLKKKKINNNNRVSIFNLQNYRLEYYAKAKHLTTRMYKFCTMKNNSDLYSYYCRYLCTLMLIQRTLYTALCKCFNKIGYTRFSATITTIKYRNNRMFATYNIMFE